MKKILIIILLISAGTSFAQSLGALEKYRNDQRGDYNFHKKGILDGNQIRTLFNNNGEVGHWPDSPSMEWPKGVPHNYVDGTALLVGTKLQTNAGVQKTVATAYREGMDEDAQGHDWGFEPIPGYAASGSTEPAINTKTKTWPATWPRAIPEIDETWDGYWYGYFGKGVQNADVETFFVMDDAKDEEYHRTPYNYIPLASQPDRGGMGLRVEVRGFQWSHVLAEDIIFWHYDIMNISDKDLSEIYFGFYSDLGVGSYNREGASYNCAYYDKLLDITYGWDSVGVSIVDKGKLGYVGYAYLESPGNSTNGLDDDEDGLLDETRDNDAGAYIFGPVGTYGPDKFHWQGDEDGDWISYVDVNGNGQWDKDENEPLNNDAGTDGIGPFDVGYVSPDADGTEGNGRPDQGEPNFGKTDKDESDQIGLTSLSLYPLIQNWVGPGWPKADEGMYDKMALGVFDTKVQQTNVQMVFASGPFPLNEGKRERFSVALAMGDNLPDLFFNKETVQNIYNANYNFSKPPLKPTLTAVPGDGKVFLYWDKVAESSRDQFLGLDPDSLGYKKDFEGYMVYRSTEAQFNQIKVITDMNGDAKYWKPIVQFDLKDSISGPDPVGINGASFNRGSNTGIRNSYIDTDVKNGMQYYYALVAYDMGDPNYGTKGLQPSENTKIITEDLAGVVTYIDQNCAVVTPNAPAAGYVPPQVTDIESDGMGSGQLTVSILNPAEIKSGAKYNLVFNSEGTYPYYTTSSYDVVRTFEGVTDTIATGIDTAYFGAGRTGTPFDGMAATIIAVDSAFVADSATGWTISHSSYSLQVSAEPAGSNQYSWPADYQIDFVEGKTMPSWGSLAPYNTGKILVNFTVTNLNTGDQVLPNVNDVNKSGVFDSGDYITLVDYVDLNGDGVKNSTERRLTWRFTYNGTGPEPAAGDQFVIRTVKPLYQGDAISFITHASSVDDAAANENLDKIGVVPNPYIGAAKWERKSIYSTGRAERKIDFINLPSVCTIRIYTVAGALVKTITKDSSPTDGSVSWNLVSDDGMDVAYGLYVYHVDAPGIGEHIGKFAVIK
jgi:hypothetical protein